MRIKVKQALAPICTAAGTTFNWPLRRDHKSNRNGPP